MYGTGGVSVVYFASPTTPMPVIQSPRNTRPPTAFPSCQYRFAIVSPS